MLAAQLLRDRIVVNISIPVGKEVRNGRTVVTERSKPDEFPRVETARLMRDIGWDMIGHTEAAVYTTLDYGLYLEMRMNRSFLRRTHNEQLPMLRKILLSGPKLPGQK